MLIKPVTASFNKIAKDLHKSFMEDAKLVLLQPHSDPIIREVTGHRERGGDRDIQAPTRWDKLVAEFYDIFDPPGMPVEQDTMH